MRLSLTETKLSYCLSFLDEFSRNFNFAPSYCEVQIGIDIIGLREKREK